MKYRAFDSFHIGYSHVKDDQVCEDHSLSCNDGSERYYIAAACDGHSDKNCFRSSKGALLGCEAAKEMLSSFFEKYIEEGLSFSDLPENAIKRLKQSIKQCWDNKVADDIDKNPFTEDELAPLSDRVRDYYKSGKGLKNIYGATFLAAGICKDLFIVMHIGDGIVLCITDDGTYIEPLPHDEKGDMGEPASICNDDLFVREKAFRCGMYNSNPTAVILSSDGIGDSVDDVQYRESIYTVLSKFAALDDENNMTACLNEAQQKYLDSFVAYYADQGHGAEDDCSFAGIYRVDKEIPKVKLVLKLAERLYDETINEYRSVIDDYEKRKRGVIDSIDEAEMKVSSSLKGKDSTSLWLEAKGKVEELKKILRTIVENEENKKAAYEKKLEICRDYVLRAGGDPKTCGIPEISEVDESYLSEDAEYEAIIRTRKETDKDQKDADEGSAETDISDTDTNIDPDDPFGIKSESDNTKASEDDGTDGDADADTDAHADTETDTDEEADTDNDTDVSSERNVFTESDDQDGNIDDSDIDTDTIKDSETGDPEGSRHPDVKLIPIGNNDIDRRDSKKEAGNLNAVNGKKTGKLHEFFSKFSNDPK
ncbi:MAG: protein phosphatase 2C domain-containing protein [Lachnospiraceae bacterium]|nr:protein phosphatase 2C domain-containing protein [Lachnospiraceae bacterium]